MRLWQVLPRKSSLFNLIADIFFFLEIIKLCVGRETEKLTTMVHDNFIPCGFLLLLGIYVFVSKTDLYIAVGVT